MMRDPAPLSSRSDPTCVRALAGRLLRALVLLVLPMLVALGVGLGAAHAQQGHMPDDAIEMPTPTERIAHPVIDELTTRDVDGMRFHYEARHASVVDPLIALAPDARERILADLSPDALDSVDIYVIPTIEDYFHALRVPVRTPHWASGLALLGHDVILVRLDPRGGARLELDRTLAHELSHIALHHHVDGRRLPTWFIEGFALLQTEQWNVDRAGPLAEAGLTDSLIPLYELNSGFPPEANRAQLAYAESGHFVRWLIAEKGRDTFREFTGRLGEGEPFAEAFEATYERSFFSYERQWRERFAVEGGWLAIVVGSTTLFFAMSVLFLALYLRVRHRRKRAFARLENLPPDEVPEHLRNFGPFSQIRSG